MACPQFKVVVLGDFMAGKTSLVNRFTRASFDPDILNTVGLDFQVKKVRASQDPVKLELWDTAGDPRFRSLIPQYVSEADALLVVYDITNLESFATARRWVLDLEDLAPSALLALVGTKVDRGSARAVSKEEAQIFSEAKKMIFAETSAKTGENVDALFAAWPTDAGRAIRASTRPFETSTQAHGRAQPKLRKEALLLLPHGVTPARLARLAQHTSLAQRCQWWG
ncbi:Ras-related protein Rab-5B [Durusdinium trenchii]|uniref:Ras-related protein Rab-5B n=1 Tax=Durusdinium trenchii TaxID=1381693 RepID=A0ABP0SMZ4_9DINO